MKPAAGAGTLTIVATPLGNAADLSPRAAEALRDADVIVAEDTRSARQLLQAGGIAKTPRILSCFDANEGARASEVAALLAGGARVVPVPGPSALLAALVAAGLPTDSFLFLGFPPRKPGPRRRLFESVRALPFTLVLYESPLRVGATLADLAAVLGDGRRACVARELTKPHEEIVRDDLGALAARYATQRPLGEVTLVIAGADPSAAAEDVDDAELMARARHLIAEGQSTRDVARALAEMTGRARRDVYKLITSARD